MLRKPPNHALAAIYESLTLFDCATLFTGVQLHIRNICMRILFNETKSSKLRHHSSPFFN